MKIDVLNGQGYITLVEHMGSDKSIVNAARVSYNADDRENFMTEKDGKLLRYLLENKHTSPFEHVQFTFEVSAPIFVFRQWHRHRTWSYNEISARYTELPENFYLPAIDEIGVQHKSNKQMRSIEVALSEERELLLREDIRLFDETCRNAFKTYRALLEHGWPRELARAVLPLATFSRMTASVDLHNLMGFLRLRLHEHAQKEIQVYAVAILYLMEQVVPITTHVFKSSLATSPAYGHLNLGNIKENLS